MATRNPADVAVEGARRTSTLLIASWVALVLLGCVLGVAVHSIKLLPGDLALARELQERRASDAILDPLLRAVTVPGNPPWAVLVYAVAVAVPAVLRRWAAAILLALTATGDAMANAIKLLVGRARPEADLVTVVWRVTGFSFPSGHVVHYVVFFGALGYLFVRALRSGTVTHPLVRALLYGGLAVALVLLALVGPSRVYLGAHWPSDVLGGYLLGSAWLLALLAAHRRWIQPRWCSGRASGAPGAAPSRQAA